MKRFVFCCITIGFLMFSCNKQDVDIYPIIQDYDVIAQSALYGNGNEEIGQENFVINKQSNWEDLISQMESVNIVADQFTETEVDFDEFTVIAVFDQLRGNSAYSVNILEIVEHKDQVNVQVSYNNSGGISNQVITQAFIIVKIPKTAKEVIFDI